MRKEERKMKIFLIRKQNEYEFINMNYFFNFY